MYPKILYKIGRGYRPVELQQVIDTELKTKNKTVVGAINEVLEIARSGGSGGTSIIYGVSNEFNISEDEKILSVASVNVNKLVQTNGDVLILNGGNSTN